MHIGNEIKGIVKRQSNIDTSKLARKIGMSRQGLYEVYKKDDINTKMLKNICEALDIPVTYFFGEKFTQNGNTNVVREPQVKYGEKKRPRVSIQIELDDSKNYNVPVDFAKKIEQLLRTSTK